MKIWEFGLTEEPLAAVLAGKKTIEGRLNRGKFAEMKPGDHIAIRSDHQDEQGVIHDGAPGAAVVEIIAVRRYASFHEMITAEGFEQIASNPEKYTDAAAVAQSYNRYYSPEDQAAHGVLAIEIKLVR